MRRYPIFLLLLICWLSGYSQSQNLVANGDFSIPYYAWNMTGNFHYNSCIYHPCDFSDPYAYTSSSQCSDIDDASGTLAESITIPNDCTGGTFSFSNNTGTTNYNTPTDILTVYFFYNGQATEITQLTNLNYTNGSCSTVSADVSAFLMQHKGLTVTLEFISTQSIDGHNTAFRIDNVQLNVTTSGGGGTTGCVNWINGPIPSDLNVVTAADYLCEHGIITSTIDVSTLPTYSLDQAAFFTVSSLYNGLNYVPYTFPCDYYPSMITNIATSDHPQIVNALTFLEYGDGTSCIPRDFFAIHPKNAVSLGDILRMLLEAYNISPDLNNQNKFSHTSSTFFSNIYTDDFNYGYFQKAKEIGLLDGYYNDQGFYTQTYPGYFFLVMLDRMYERYGNQHPALDSAAFYVPNNLKPTNTSGAADITKAAFETYEHDGFHIPSSGIGLDFNYSYHSDLTDMPLLNMELPSGSVEMESVKERLYPLGIGWTFSYNIYIQTITDNAGNDAYLAVHWGDGSLDMISVQNGVGQYLTQGKYCQISGSNLINGHVQNFSIKTKDQITYVFKKDGGLLLLQSITDRNNNYLTFVYEPSVCSQRGYGATGTYSRLVQVTDNFGGRYLHFTYYPGTDVLNAVNDNTGRTITFYVDWQNLNLSSSTNQKNFTTNYAYYYGNGYQNLLQSITRPKRNVITASYNERKLQIISTPNYSATIHFGTAYTSTSTSVQTSVQVSPLNGTAYTTSYNYGNIYNLIQSTSNSSNIAIEYSDQANPTLPTLITNIHQDLFENFKYDVNGNILQHSITGQNNNSQVESFMYDEVNDIISHTLQNGSVITYTYDNQNNLTNESGPLGYNKTYTRDQFERITKETDGTATISIGYNGYGNLNSISYDGTAVKQSAVYDDLSRIMDITDGNGHITQYSYDPDDNITSITADKDSLKLTTQYMYDENDNIHAIIDPNNDSTTLQYNNSDDLEKEFTSNNIVRSWNYNNDGTLQQYINKNGAQFNYLYYPQGDPNEGKIQSDGYRSYEYYPTNNMLDYLRFVDGTSEYQYSYDDLLRIKNQNYSAPNISSSVGYTYDNSNNVTQISLGTSGKNFNYSYDALNRISEVKDWNNASLVKYNYSTSGLLDYETLGNGVVVHYQYDAAERLDSIWSVKSDGTRLHAVGCSLDNNGNHIRESFFVKWNGANYSSSVFQPPTYHYDANNRMTDANGTVLKNDNEGNVYTNLQSNFTADYYNFDNNLLSCTADGKNKQFAYDPAGVRYADDDNIYTLDNLHNSNIVGVQQRGSSDYTLLYAHSPYGLVCSIDPNTNSKTYYLYDFRGSTVALVDDNQTVKQYYKYDPFGQITESSDSLKTATPFLFVGKYGVMYESPHLYYMRARYYDPVAGRFYGPDKNWSTNLFTYGANNSLSNIDPTGRDVETNSEIGSTASESLKLGFEDLKKWNLFELETNGLPASLDYGNTLDKIISGLGYASVALTATEISYDIYAYRKKQISLSRLTFDLSSILLSESLSKLPEYGGVAGLLIDIDIFSWEIAYEQWQRHKELR